MEIDGAMLHQPNFGNIWEVMIKASVDKGGGPFVVKEGLLPEPDSGHVRVKVQACAVCHSDALTRRAMVDAETAPLHEPEHYPYDLICPSIADRPAILRRTKQWLLPRRRLKISVAARDQAILARS
jgi:hypothetical protein